MANEWPLARVGDLAESISETHPLGKEKLIFLNTSDVLLGKILHHSYSPTKDWPGQAKKSIQRDDILFSEIRPANGRYAYVDVDAEDYVVSTKLMVIRARKHRIVPRFLYHFLTSRKITRWLQHLAESRSGTFPQITFDQIAELELPLPPITEQAAVSAFLDGIDSSIELNHRMNETLEAMARAIFKSWFVDFDPVRAKAEGRKPFGMDAETAALFSDSFEDSPLGKIPKGWRVCTVGDEVEVGGGSTPSTKEGAYWDGEIHWATPKDLSVLHTPVLIATERRITQAGLEQIGSRVYPSGSVLLSSRAPIGYLAITEIPVAVNQGMIAMACGTNPSNHYMLQWTRSNMEVIESRASGTTFQEISKGSFRSISLLLPTDAVMRAFTEKAELFHRQIVNNVRESETLAAMRDTFLPKLISGEIRVKDVNSAVEH